ncbi:MAG TPA: acyltransferase [Devosiaceae bacterium]|nr:acyltransferase [Devosiaceae bacterium]
MPIRAEHPALRDPHADGKGTLYGVQALRFIAAALVVITHALNREVVLFHPAPLPRAPWMEAGVDIFFVISGFIMVHILTADSKPGAFWLQRFTRIAPLYWLATAIAFIGGLVAPEWFFGRADWLFALKSALFMPLGAGLWPHPLISPGWTLVFEFAFYTLLAFCLVVRRPPFALAIGIIVAALIVNALFKGRLPLLGYYFSDLMMIEFLYGMAAAAVVRRIGLRPWQGLVLALVGLVLIALLFPGGMPRGVQVGLPAFLVVVGFLASEPLWQRNKPMQQFARLGDASYSIYLVHFFFVTALATAFQKSPALQSLGPLAFVTLAVALGLGAGVLAHIFVERPLLRAVRALLPGRGRKRSAPAQTEVEAKV